MGNITKKITSVLLSATTVVWLSGSSVLLPVVANAQSTDLQSQINALLAQIAALQAQLAAAGGASAACTFTNDLTVGSKGAAVKCLQQYLNGAGGAKVAASGVGSAGSETEYFGSLTAAAVAKWQAANGVSPTAGYFGARSRAKYSVLVAGAPAPAPAPGPVVGGSGLTVTLAPDQPASGLFGESFASRAFTKLKFTASSDGDVSVKALLVERTGQGADAAFNGVIPLDDDGIRFGTAKTFSSDHRLRLTEKFVVKAGQTRTITIAGDSDNNQDAYNGQLVSLSLVGVEVDGSAAINASYPMVGATHTVNSTLAIGALTLAKGSYDPGSGLTEEIGTTSYIFSGLRLTAGTNENVLVKSIQFNQSGSASITDLANVKVVLDGTTYDTTVSSDGKYFTANFGSGLQIDKGLNKELYIKGDVTGGSARTVDFDLYRYADLQVKGLTYGYELLPSATETTADNDDDSEFQTAEPRYDASQVYINAGTITAQNAPAVGAQNVAVNLSNQPLGGLLVDVKGEDITVASMNFDMSITKDAGDSVDTDDVTNITLVREDGVVVAGPVDGVAAGNNAVRFTDTVTFKPGRTVYTLKGKIGTDIGSNDTIVASTTPSTDWVTVRGVTSGVTITPSPASAVTMSTMTAKAAALTVSLTPETQSNASTTGQTVVAGTSTYLFTTYVLDASGSGEDVRVTSLKLVLTASSSNTADDLTNCQLYKDSTVLNTGSNIVNPSNSDAAGGVEKTFSLDTSLIIAKGTIQKLDIKCNIVSGANGSGQWQWGVTDVDASLNATGVTSGQTVDGSDSISGTDAGRVIAVATSGTLAYATDPSSPSLKWAQAGSADNTMAVFRFNATNEDIRIDKIGLQMATSTLSSATMASNSPSDLSKVTVWDGATKVGEAVFSSTDYATATLNLASAVVVPKNGQKLLTVKADVAGIYTSGPARPGHLVLVNYDASSSSNCAGGVNTSCQRGAVGVGMSSGVAVGSGGSDSATNGARIARAVPAVVKVALASTKFSNTTGQSLYRFKVSAPAGTNGVSLYKFGFNIATNTSSVTELPDVDGGGVDPTFSSDFRVTNIKLYCYSDSGFSVPSCGSWDNSGLLNQGGFGVMTGNAADVGPTATSTDTDDLVNQDDPDLDFDVFFNPVDSTLGSTQEAIRVPAGETRYFVLKADITGASSTPTIAVKMNGDATLAGLNNSVEEGLVDGDLLDYTTNGDNWNTGRYVFATAASQVDAWDDDQFIWSGNSTNTTQDVADYDWFNGYQVPGLSNTDIGESETLTLQ